MRLKEIWQEYDQIIGIVFVLVLITSFVIYKKGTTNQVGIITVAKITKYEPAESGSSLFADVYVGNETVSVEVNETCSNFEVGKYYFARIKKNRPKDYPIIYCDKMVPECIVNSTKYYKGWNVFPDCDEISK